MLNLCYIFLCYYLFMCDILFSGSPHVSVGVGGVSGANVSYQHTK